MSMTTERELIATTASTVPGLNVRARQTVRTPTAGDGWVNVESVRIAGYRTVDVRWEIVVVLSADRVQAEKGLETYAIPVLDAVTVIPCSDVELRPIEYATEQGGTLYGFTLTITTEVGG